MTLVILFTGFIVASGVICHMVAERRGKNPIYWGVMGALFGPLAIPFLLYATRENGQPPHQPQ